MATKKWGNLPKEWSTGRERETGEEQGQHIGGWDGGGRGWISAVVVVIRSSKSGGGQDGIPGGYGWDLTTWGEDVSSSHFTAFPPPIINHHFLPISDKSIWPRGLSTTFWPRVTIDHFQVSNPLGTIAHPFFGSFSPFRGFLQSLPENGLALTNCSLRSSDPPSSFSSF